MLLTVWGVRAGGPLVAKAREAKPPPHKRGNSEGQWETLVTAGS